MKVEQIYAIMNSITNELLGDSIIVAEDLSNIVELGQRFEDVVGLDAYVKKLPDHVGKIVFCDRPYEGRAVQVLMDSWEYGSILEKLATRIPEAVENEDWQLTDGTSYDPNVFHAPEIYGEFYNKRVTFEIDMSITRKQVKSSFDNVTQLNSFLSMILNAIETSLTIKLDALIMRTVNNMVGETLYSEMPSGTYSGTSGVKAVNLLYLYNQKYSANLTADKAIVTPEFIRFAAYTMANYMDRLKVISTLFNVANESKFTPASKLHVAMLSEFKNAADIFLQSEVFNSQYTALPNSDSVPFWQGSGTDYGFSSTSAIKIKTASGHDIDATGVLAVMFDRDALGVSNLDKEVRTHYNSKADFWNYFYSVFAGSFNSTNENFVVFYAA